MYRSTNDGLGFSLKPPSWLRNLVGNVTGAAQQTQAAVDSVAANYPTAPMTPAPGTPSGAMPSWLPYAALGVVVFLMLGGKHRRF